MKTTYKCKYPFIAEIGRMFFMGDEIDSIEYDQLLKTEQLNFKKINYEKINNKSTY